MYKVLIAVATLLSVPGIALPQLSRPAPRNILTRLTQKASDIEITFQPWVDYDGDSCYNTAAVSPDGEANEGKGQTGTPEGDCRDPHQLENSNTYSRVRCNHGICAVMYEYYFEKDQNALGTYGSGHRHDWENVVVFVKDGKVVHTATSCHDNYGGDSDFHLGEGTHPYVVYHKDGPNTHCFRKASEEDMDNPENYTGEFYSSPLVGWYGWPEDLVAWDGLVNKDFDGLVPKIYDSKFAEYLGKAAGDSFPDFDPSYDE